MKLPLFLGMPKQSVPDWLVQVAPMHASSRIGKVTFDSLVLVTNRKGQYQARRVLPFGNMFRIDGCYLCDINFQSPPGGSGGVVMDVRPIIPEWAVNLAVIIAAIAFVGYR